MIAKFLNWLSKLTPNQLLMMSGGAAVVMFAIMYFAFSTLTENNDDTPLRQETPVISTQSVVVAKSNIAAQTVLKKSMLEFKELPEEMIPRNAVTDMSEVLNKATKAEIFAGDVITSQKIYKDSTASGFVGKIPSDCRAVSISVNDLTGVAGFAKPGDYVDVVLVEKTDNVAASSILLQNVLLLSINDNMGVQKNSESEENSSEQAINSPTTATLALKPDEVLQVTSASKLGELYLVLRPFKPQEMYAYNADVKFQTLKSQENSSSPKQPTTPEATNPVAPTPPVASTSNASDEKPVKDHWKESDKIEIMYGDAPVTRTNNTDNK